MKHACKAQVLGAPETGACGAEAEGGPNPESRSLQPQGAAVAAGGIRSNAGCLVHAGAKTGAATWTLWVCGPGSWDVRAAFVFGMWPMRSGATPGPLSAGSR